jgi:hypothetical protein
LRATINAARSNTMAYSLAAARGGEFEDTVDSGQRVCTAPVWLPSASAFRRVRFDLRINATPHNAADA